MSNYTIAYLALAAPEHKAIVEAALAEAGDDWAVLQSAFLDRMDAYVETELHQERDHLIDSHEAGGAWRIGFPHYHLRGDGRIVEHMARVMEARRRYTDQAYYHGFPDEAEVHHEIETFIYFQNPLVLLGLEGSDVALASVQDVAHHVGNWVSDVPEWYDWEQRGFQSTWLGTRNVRAYPPFDYQEANHFRFIATALTVYSATGQERYLGLATNYADRWCEHIETRAADGGPIQCSILPSGALSEELGHAGKATDTRLYQIFYAAVAPNTTYEVSGVLLDLYRLTGNERYLVCSRLMLDQFFEHGQDGRPALAYRHDAWDHERGQDEAFSAECAISQNGAMLARPALRHDLITGEERYRDRILSWAQAIDEVENPGDQMTADVLVAAHYYTGNPAWLARAYAMDLRTWAVVEQNPSTHMCSSLGRYGSKFLMELSYQPMLGGVDWGTRVGLSVERLRHVTDGHEGLPASVAFRVWREGEGLDGFEAVNRGTEPVAWCLASADDQKILERAEIADPLAAQDAVGHVIRIAPDCRVLGRLHWRR